MEKVGPNSKFVGHSTEIILQSKIKGPLRTEEALQISSQYVKCALTTYRFHITCMQRRSTSIFAWFYFDISFGNSIILATSIGQFVGIVISIFLSFSLETKQYNFQIFHKHWANPVKRKC